MPINYNQKIDIMNCLRIGVLCSAILIISSTVEIYSQWTADTSGMGKIGVSRLIFFGNSMISGSRDSGIYVKSRNEKIWSKISNSPMKITDLVISGNNIVAGTFDDGVYYSTDIGKSWVPSNMSTRKIITIYENKKSLLAGTDIGVFSSTDNGINWSNTSMKTATYSIAEIGAKFYAGTNKGLYVSTSLIGIWTKIFEKTTNSIISIEDTLLIANNDGSIWKKRKNDDWSMVYSLGRDIYKLLSISNIVFGGTYQRGIKCSTDYGTSWQENCVGQNTFMQNSTVWDIVLLGSKLYACTGGGIYSTDLRFCIEQ